MLRTFSPKGFVGALSALPRSALDRADTNLPIYLDDVHCLGDEPALSYCIHNGVGVHNCRHWEDASVICQGTAPPPPHSFTAFRAIIIQLYSYCNLHGVYERHSYTFGVVLFIELFFDKEL